MKEAARRSLMCLLVCAIFLSPATGRAQDVTEDCTVFSEVVMREGHYYTRTNEVLTWSDAAGLAERIGEYLVVPDTSWENAWIVEQGWGDSWIGIYDPAESPAWCSGACGEPCACPVGLKCPPAEGIHRLRARAGALSADIEDIYPGLNKAARLLQSALARIALLRQQTIPREAIRCDIQEAHHIRPGAPHQGMAPYRQPVGLHAPITS